MRPEHGNKRLLSRSPSPAVAGSLAKTGAKEEVFGKATATETKKSECMQVPCSLDEIVAEVVLEKVASKLKKSGKEREFEKLQADRVDYAVAKSVVSRSVQHFLSGHHVGPDGVLREPAWRVTGCGQRSA